MKQLERGEASLVDLKKNLEYAATVLESVYVEETRYARGATHRTRTSTNHDLRDSDGFLYIFPGSLKMQFCLMQRDAAAQQ